MTSHSEGGWLTSTGSRSDVNVYTTHETLSCGIVRTTRRKEMKTGWRWYFGIVSLGITELTGTTGDYFTYTYSYQGRELGANENDAADRAYEIGCDYFKQGKYDEAKQWLDIAHQTCKSGYTRESVFRDKADAAREKMQEEKKKEREETEKAKQKKDQQEKENQPAETVRQEIKRRENRQKVAKQWQHTKAKVVCSERARKKCEDRALHRRDKHTVLFCSAEVYQKQSQMEVNDIPDGVEFTEVFEETEQSIEILDEDDETSGSIEEDDVFEGTAFQEINEIDIQVERLLKIVLQNTSNEITSFQEQMFYMTIYRILDAVNPIDIDVTRLLEATSNIVKINRMDIHDFLSVATLIISSSRLQKLMCMTTEPSNLLNELKSTWLHHILSMKSIEHSDSDLNKFLNVATKFDFNFFVIATQKGLLFYTEFKDLLNFFVKIQKCPLTNKSKQQFVHLLPDGSSPLLLLAECLIESYFFLKFSNFGARQSKSLETIEFDVSCLNHFKAVILSTKAEHEHVLELKQITIKLFIGHWNFNYLDQLLGLVDKASKIQPMATCLLHVHDFGSPNLLTTGEMVNIIENCKAHTWRERVHCALVERAFPENTDSLNETLDKLNKELQNFDFETLCAYLKSDESTSAINVAINKLNKKDIKRWSQTLDASSASLYEIIAVLNRAVELHSGHKPRDVQNMALLLLLDKIVTNTGGRLLQVNTGEGKTLIVAMFATIMTLRGHTVDVITSSPELAKPQCEKMSSFYELFNQTTAYVTPDCTDKARKKAYEADIIYGAAQEFQGDVLRDEYSQMGTRSGRKFDVAVVDEVDSMLMDGRNHLVMLSSPVPGMENLEALLATIWNHINMVEIHLIEKNGQVYLVDQCNRINEDGSLKPEEDCIDNASPITQTKLDFIKEQTEKFMRLLLRDYDNLESESKELCATLPEMSVPRHLREFVLKVQLKKWIESAIFAKYAYRNNQHYVIKNGSIAPVDANNTGIVQANMQISNGIHQFLQIKHGAKICPETYTTNYISNVSFFKRYGQRLVGLTGTLGSDSAHRLLKRVYDVDTVIIPPFKTKQYRQLETVFVESHDDWILSISQSCIRKLEVGRAVLVISRYLSEVDLLQKSLIEQGLKESKIHLYKTEENSRIVERELKSGEVIIATNIAGRGTDISVSKEVEKHGGLHVCLTFLPVNERVEIQNFGRTSRTGNRGTGQFVIFRCEDSTIEEVKRARDEIESNQLLEAEGEIHKILIKDRIFIEFCALLKHTRMKFENKGRLECENNARAIEERFGLWLKENEDKLESDRHFQSFCSLAKEELKTDTFIRNPYFFVIKGNLLMDQKFYDLAINEYTHGIQLDDRFLSNAYYNRGYCKILLYSQSYKKNIAHEAVADFKKAKEIIEDRIERDLFLIQQSAPASEALSEQVSHMLTLFHMQKNSIECAIGKGTGYIEEELKRLTNPDNNADADEVEQYIKRLKENQVRLEQGVIGEAILNGNKINVVLNSIESSLPPDEILSLYEHEIDTFRNNGNLGSFEVKLIKPINWWSVISLAMIGLGQMVAGAAIAVFSVGAGASIGFGMLVEGVTDLITCVVDGLINRDFNWAAWSIQKCVSYTVTIACAGLSALKNAAKVAYHGVKQAASTVTKGLTTVACTGWKLAAKKAGLELSKGVARKLINGLASNALDFTVMPLVERKIMDCIQNPVMEITGRSKDVAMLLEFDRNNRNAHYQQVIVEKAVAILHPSSEISNIVLGLVRGLQQIGEGVTSNKIEGMSQALMLIRIEKALIEILKLFPDFIRSLETEIATIAHKHRDMEAEQQGAEGRKATVTSTEEQVKLEEIKSSHSDLAARLCQAVASTMCNIINGNLISPLLYCAIYEGVNSLTSEISKSVNESTELFKSQSRLILLQDGDKHGLIPTKYKQGTKNSVAAAKARHVVDSLENGGEAGLPMLGAVSDTINRPVTVLDSNGNVMMNIGEDKPGKPVHIQYHEPTDIHPGHWTGPNGTEPITSGRSSNNCLFDAVADQLQADPDRLRDSVCGTLKSDKHLNLLASGARDIDRLQNSKEKYLIYGGVIGYTANSGKKIAANMIAKSQGQTSQGKDGKPHKTKNHPHGHVLSSNSGQQRQRGIDCLENYSADITDPRYAKSGVLSKDIQAELTDYVLSTNEGQQAIERMNDPNESKDAQLEQRVRVKIPQTLLTADMTTWDKSGEISRCKLDEYEVRIRRPEQEKKQPDKTFPPDVFTAFPLAPQSSPSSNPASGVGKSGP